MVEMKIGTDAWENFKAELAANFKPGELISHEYLKEKFKFKKITFIECADTLDFVKSIEMQQFAYMTLIDSLRWELLKEYQLFLRNIRGEGYSFLPPTDQVRFAYDQAMTAIRKEINEANLIMNNVLSVDAEQQKADNDARARFAMLKQLLKGLK